MFVNHVCYVIFISDEFLVGLVPVSLLASRGVELAPGAGTRFQAEVCGLAPVPVLLAGLEGG